MIALAESRPTSLGDLPVVRLRTRWGRLVGNLLEKLDNGPVLVHGPQCAEAAPVAITRVFACVDGSEDSESILPLAADIASESAATLWLLNVVTSRPTEVSAAGMESLHANYLQRLAGWLSVDWERPNWELLHDPDPAAGIVGHIRRRGALAMTTRGGGEPGEGLGTVAIRVLLSARAPVIMMAPNDAAVWRPRRVLASTADLRGRIAQQYEEEPFVAPILRLVPPPHRKEETRARISR